MPLGCPDFGNWSMARRSFHKNQAGLICAGPVGTLAFIERVVSAMDQGLESEFRIFYDVGLGRDFAALTN